MNKKIITILSAAIAATLCCITPVLAVLAGSASFASSFLWLAPYHNYLVVFTLLILAYAWYDKLRAKKDITCCEEENFFSGKLFLGLVTLFVFVMLSFPIWGNKFFHAAPSAQSCATGACETELKEVKKSDCKDGSCDSEKKEITKEDCKSGTCPTPRTINEENSKEIDTASLPVLQYMQDEKENPTECGQVACSGTGFQVLDDLMAEARAEVEEMSPAVLKKMIDDEVEFVLLDVREAIQRAEGEIYADEMLAIPRTNLEFEIMNKVKNKNKTIVVYSRMGARSLFAAQSLKKLGYTSVYNLSAGLKGWVRAKYPYDNGLGTVLKVVDAQ